MRYIALRPTNNWLEEKPLVGRPTIYERLPVYTGLLDKSGVKIYRVEDTVGFVRAKSDD